MLVLLSGDAAAAVAEFAEGVVEIAAIEAHPIEIAAFVLVLALLHQIEKIEQILFNILMFKFILLSSAKWHHCNIIKNEIGRIKMYDCYLGLVVLLTIRDTFSLFSYA